MRTLSFHLLTFVSLCAAFGTLGCSGRNIHSELNEDRKIMLRKWTLPTHPPFEAGDRGTEYSNPVFVDQTLVFGNRSVGLIALYPKVMETRWVLPISGGVVSEIEVDRGTAYFGGGDGFLYAVNLENGKVLWRYDLRNPQISRPTLNGGRLFVTTTDDTVYAFDAGTGKWLWHYPRRSSLSATIIGSSQPLVDGNDVIAGLSDGFLVALNVQDGSLKWERKLHQASRFMDVDAHPVLADATIYVSSYDGSLYALKRQTGEVLWRFDSGGNRPVTLEEQRIYYPSTDGYIYALNKSNSKVLWKFEIDKGVPSQLVLTDKYVIVGSSHQYLYVIDKETGKGVYRFNAGYDSGFTGTPAFDVSSQSLYMLSQAGNLYSFVLRKPWKKGGRNGAAPDPYEFKTHL